jgi:ribosomal protein S18 acetylase RimI-like enzyme
MLTNNAAYSRIIIEEHDLDDIRTKLQNELREYNRPFLGQYERSNFAAYIKDDNQNIIAAMCGFIIMPHKTARLEHVWVAEKYRGQGIGSVMLDRVEQYAISKSCDVIQAATGEWHAPHFYQKRGYKEIARVPKWFCGKDEIYFCKELKV